MGFLSGRVGGDQVLAVAGGRGLIATAFFCYPGRSCCFGLVVVPNIFYFVFVPTVADSFCPKR